MAKDPSGMAAVAIIAMVRLEDMEFRGRWPPESDPLGVWSDFPFVSVSNFIAFHLIISQTNRSRMRLFLLLIRYGNCGETYGRFEPSLVSMATQA